MICVVVPSNRSGGLDILEASIARQTVKPTHLLFADELFKERQQVVSDMFERLEIEGVHFKPHQPVRNAARNLVAAYNQSIDIARDLGYSDDDLFISLQDYIWLPENGIERFMMLNIVAPDSLITGVTHISLDPFSTKIMDINGSYTIFDEAYTEKPKRIFWKDPRPNELYKTSENNKIVEIAPEHWEANWAAIPFKVFNLGARWSEIYDTGYAYENMDFAMKCSNDHCAQILMDADNIAISLPHREYFSGEAEDLIKYNNKELHEKIWS